MALLKFLGCFICGSEKCEENRPVVPVQYDVEGKNPQRSSAKSEDSFDSEAECVNEEKAVRTSIPAKETEREVEQRNRALVVAARGTYDYMDHPFPTMAHEKEVVIANRAAGLNPIDHKSVDYNFCLPEFPWITGREMAGIVEAVGSGVEGLKVGDKVWTSRSPLNFYPISCILMQRFHRHILPRPSRRLFSTICHSPCTYCSPHPIQHLLR
jgi:hypothetical protein